MADTNYLRWWVGLAFLAAGTVMLMSVAPWVECEIADRRVGGISAVMFGYVAYLLKWSIKRA